MKLLSLPVPIQTSVQKVLKTLSPVVKQPQQEADKSSRPKVMEWNYTFAPPYAFMKWKGTPLHWHLILKSMTWHYLKLLHNSPLFSSM